MSARFRFSFYFLLAAALLAASVKPISAQEPPSVTDYIDPATAYHTSNFDYVDPLNRRVALDIPLLVDHSQRGNLNFTYSIRYASTTTWYLAYYGYYYQWTPANGAVNGPSLSVDGNLKWGESTYDPCSWHCPEYAQYAQDDTGAVHYLGDANPGSNYESVDGSGIQYNVNSRALINRQGVQFTSAPGFGGPGTEGGGQITDPNGNFLTFWCESGNSGICGYPGSATKMEDTVGRIWGRYYQVDTSGCPYPTVQADLWQVPGPNGQMRNFTLCYKQWQLRTSFGQPSVTEYSGTALLLSAVMLPDGTSWQFNYDVYGELVWVQLPTGGTVTYGWTTLDYGTRVITSRQSFDGNNTSTWSYNGFTVTDPAGNDAVYAPNSLDVADDGRINSIQYFNGPASDNNVLKTMYFSYQTLDNPYPVDLGDNQQVTYLSASTEIQWPNGMTNETAQTHDFTFTFTDDNDGSQHTGNYGSLTWVHNYDFGNGSPGSVLSRIGSSPEAAWVSNYLTANMLDLPAYQFIENGSWIVCSWTDFGYDESGYSPGGTRGNLTTVSPWLSTNQCQSGATGTSLPSHRYVNGDGTLQRAVDAKGNPTTFNYSSGVVGPTSVCNALNQCTTYGYDSNTGLVASVTDPNNQTTSYNYDIMLRPTSVNYPDGGQTTTNYSPNLVTVTKAIVSGQTMSTNYVFDGLGRMTQSQLTSDPEGIDYTDMSYVYSPSTNTSTYTASNPYRSQSDSTYGVTQYQSDALGRVINIIEQDNRIVNTDYIAFPCTTVTDETGKSRKSCVDGLGRVISVQEDPSGVNYQTTYGYDPMGNLISVAQNGSRQRTFTYDSLSRLICAQNPEIGTTSCPSPDNGSYTAGTVRYSYDNNGNAVGRIQPTPNQTNPANTVTATYTYDALNRITSKSYSDSTPPVCYLYDNASSEILPHCNITNAPSGTNAIGRLSTVYYNTPNTSLDGFGYDTMGRLAAFGRNIEGRLMLTYFDYNLAGLLSEIDYPSSRRMQYYYNNAGRVTTAQEVGGYECGSLTCITWGGATYASNISYFPNGAMASMGYWGNSLTYGWNYDNRLRPTSISAVNNGTTQFNLGYSYYANGNVQTQADYVQGNTFNYGYDSLNRLQSATASGAENWSQNFSWDAWGNPTNTSINASNQIVGYCYDAAGNLLGITACPNSTYSYDAEGHMSSASGANYYYNGDGQRVKKVAAGNTMLYATQGSTGPVLTEAKNGTWFKDYIYVNGMLVATHENDANWVNYYVSDHLGTPRVTLRPAWSLVCRHDYQPFGQEVTNCSDNDTHKFTGQERDPESGNDYFGARYYSSSLGRFMTPDPSNLSVDFWMPQTWNRYSYVLNNPLSIVDRNGLWPTYIHNEIINEAFPGFSLQELQALRDASYNMDYGPGQQSVALSFEHGMSNGVTGQDPLQADQQGDAFIAQNEQKARQIQADWLASGHKGIAPAALTAFGNALHTTLDRTSPMHNQPWYGIFDPLRSLAHFLGEFHINQTQMNAAVQAAQSAFQQTFGLGGDEFDLMQLLFQPQPVVTSTILPSTILESESGCSDDGDCE